MKKYFPVELHCHTNHSDGSMSPGFLVESAKKRGYAAIAVTDHNTASAFESAAAAGEKYGVCVIKGIEWTTFFGHIVCLHDDANVADWRELNMDNIDAHAEKARGKNAVLTLAHPMRVGAPAANGCRMEFRIKRFDLFSAVEVWSQNDPPDSRANVLSEKMYDGILSGGFRLAAVYGFDWHSPGADLPYFINTYIGAENLNAEDLKEGIRRGDTYIAMGLQVELLADGEKLPFGAEIGEGEHTFELKISKGLCQGEVLPLEIVLKGTAIECGEKAREAESEDGLKRAVVKCGEKMQRAESEDGLKRTVVECGEKAREAESEDGGNSQVKSVRFGAEEKMRVQTRKGFLRFEVHGIADGKRLPLVFTSPVWVVY
ncbi:MAG: CehA/McbA family metallohydrolase [Clostridiales bacterium]|jgi:hypothetical protein|nr:CehA/McbA family metallohydrolase [Clostridiales bacterium]